MFGVTGHMCIWFPFEQVPTPVVPENAYVEEDGITPYVGEDGVTYYVQENP